MTGTPPETFLPLTPFAKTSGMPSMSLPATRSCGHAMDGIRAATSFRFIPSVWCTGYAVRKSKSSPLLMADDDPVTGALASEEPSNFRLQPSAARFARCGG